MNMRCKWNSALLAAAIIGCSSPAWAAHLIPYTLGLKGVSVDLDTRKRDGDVVSFSVVSSDQTKGSDPVIFAKVDCATGKHTASMPEISDRMRRAPDLAPGDALREAVCAQ